MVLNNNTIQERITDKFNDAVSDFHELHDIFVFEAQPVSIKEIVSFMKDDEILRFNFLTDICGVHYPDNDVSRQFAVVYHLHNWMDNVRVRIKIYLDADKVEADTVTDVFACANWMERETFDFYGIKFVGHPNLKKILNDDAMTSFPMRKEFPLEDAERTDKDDRFFGRVTNNNQK